MTDKIVKAFEALRNHYLQEAKEQTSSGDVPDATTPNKKKDLALSSRERITHCNTIADFLPMQTVRDMNEFSHMLALAMELLLVCCDDVEADVRLVAGECINRTIKAFLDSNIGRIQVELYKEIKKNGKARCLRAAMQRFGETCHLIRANKCRPYVQNLLPCIVKISRRVDDSIQESLCAFMLKVLPVLGSFMIDMDAKILLKAFLPNLKSSSATTRRTAAAILNKICSTSKKPLHYYSWTISMLLGMITPLNDDLESHTILGVLLAFRNIISNLSDVEEKSKVIKGTFGFQSISPEHKDDRVIEKKQFLQVYEVTMFCTKHTDHNVVTAALENLLQLLQCEAKPLREILLSQSGIAPTITGQLATLSDSKQGDSPYPSEYGGSTSDLQSMTSLSASFDGLAAKDKIETSSLNEAALGEAGQTMESVLFSALPNIPTVEVTDDTDESSIDTGIDVTDEIISELDDERLSLPRTYTQGSMINIESAVSFQRDHLGSVISDIPNDSSTHSSMDDLHRFDSVLVRSSIERYFNFDAVACSGVPLLHCVRLMCSFLLSGESGEILPDQKTRVSVKSLALNCIAFALKLYPESICGYVLPNDMIQENEELNDFQLIRDVILLHKHDDPQIKGAVSMVIGNLFSAIVKDSQGELNTWNLTKCSAYETEELDLVEWKEILLQMLKDESAITIKQACVAIRKCLTPLLWSSFNIHAFDLCWSLLNLVDCSYWLVKVELMEILQEIDYRLIKILQPHWIQVNKCSSLSIVRMDFQEHVVNNIIFNYLSDEDARVRLAAAHTCVKLIPNLSLCHNNQSSSLVKDMATFYKDEIKNNPINLNVNLSYIVRQVIALLNKAISKYLLHGCTQLLYHLSVAYPVYKHLFSWEVLPPFKKKGVEKPLTRDRGITIIKSQNAARKLAFEDTELAGSFGLMSMTFDLISATWMTIDLQAHQQCLKLCVHLLCGAAYNNILKKVNEKEESVTENTVAEAQWSSLKDPQLMIFAQKLFIHFARVLAILHDVIEMVNPLAASAKFQIGFPNQNKDKTPIPGTATVATPPNQTPNNQSPAVQSSNSPRKFNLPKAMQRKSESNPEANKPQVNSTPENKQTPTSNSTSEKSERMGTFHSLFHYMKLYEILKGAFKNYQVSPVAVTNEKFIIFTRGVLESFSLFFELMSFNELGSHAEEILDYLQATAKVEEETSFLAVQQLLKGLFGTNFTSQPETFKLANSTDHLLKYRGDPTFSYDCNFDEEKETQENVKTAPQTPISNQGRAVGLLNKFRKSISSSRPNMKVNKDRIASIQSYIRLFEPLVIQALKSYTTTSSTNIQCQSIHLLDQLIRLRVNYSLLDSDQVFIGFVLKQFDFIENGQVKNPEVFIPTVFQFLVLLSYECYQPKFKQAKAIIGMPRIMKLCDDVMACGQPAITHAIPSLKPIVHDLFAPTSQARPDSIKDLDTQREVVISMLLRVIHYPEVLEMLTKVLAGCKSDEEKWKKLSRQIVDALLPGVTKLQIDIDSLKDLNVLNNLMDSIAPLALRPADIILKCLFDIPVEKINSCPIKVMSMVLSLLRTLISHNSEDIILSRILELDLYYVKTHFSLFENAKEFDLKSNKTETAASLYFASFLISILKIVSENLEKSYSDVTVNSTKNQVVISLIEMFYSVMIYLAKSGKFRKICAQLYTLMNKQESLIGSKETNLLDCITNYISPIRHLEPHFFLSWLGLLEKLQISNLHFWRKFWTEDNVAEKNCTYCWTGDLIKNGAFVCYCSIISKRMKEQRNIDLSLPVSLLKDNFNLILECIDEKPVEECLSQLLRMIELSTLFLQKITLNFIPFLKNSKPTLLLKVFHHLESIDLSLSGDMVLFLMDLLPNIRSCGIVRKYETLICRRVEYLMSLPAEEHPLPMESFLAFTKKKKYSHRYPRLFALIQRCQKQLIRSSPVLHGSHPLEMPQINLDEYKVNKDWVFDFVKDMCVNTSSVDMKPSKNLIYLLRSLNVKDIEEIMTNEKFNLHLLNTCADQSFTVDKLKSSNKQKKTEPQSIYDSGGSTDRESKEKISALCKSLTIKSIKNFHENFKDSIKIDDKEYLLLKENEIAKLKDNSTYLNEYLIRLKCLIKLLSPCCFYNQSWDISGDDAETMFQFLLIIPKLSWEICLHQNNSNNLYLIEYCFKALTLVLHCREFTWIFLKNNYVLHIIEMIDICYQLISNLSLRFDSCFEGLQEHHKPNKHVSSIAKSSEINECLLHSCNQVSDLVHAIRSVLSKSNRTKSCIPKFLSIPIFQTVCGLARIPVVNSFARIPPIVWKFGWQPKMEGVYGTELPPLPVEILKEKDVLTEFVFRVNLIGWISRMQFEETWAALLGVLSSPPVSEDASVEEEIEMAQSSCVAVHCITSLLLDTTLSPVPGNPSISLYSVIHRQKEYSFLNTKMGKRYNGIRKQIESSYFNRVSGQTFHSSNNILYPVIPSLLPPKQRKQQIRFGCMVEGKLFGSNLELPLLPTSIKFGQISAAALRLRLVSSDVQEDTDSNDSDSLIIKVNDKTPPPTPQATIDISYFRKFSELDIRSCLQFLLELFEQWLSPYVTPKTPLVVKMEAIRGLCVLSDLLLELNHYEWVLGILLEVIQTHYLEDDIMSEYLIPTLCKSLAVLKLEGTVAERISKHVEQCLKTPHVPLQVSCLVGSLYILESFVSSTNVVLVPILTEYLTKKLSSPADTSSVNSVRLTTMLWSISFFLIDNCSSEIQDTHFPSLVLESSIHELCKVDDCYPTEVIDVLLRGLERLAVSSTLLRSEYDRLGKVAASCVASSRGNLHFSALGLLCTCMYAAKDIMERVGDNSPPDNSNDGSLNDVRIAVLERINILLNRIRSSQLSEANLLADVLPRILLDFLPIQEVMNRIVSEFLSSQQPRPELLAKIFDKVSNILSEDGDEVTVRDWLLLCIGSFVQRTPISMAVWSLSCFFISASSNAWLKSLFPFVVLRKGWLEQKDLEIFHMAAIDFFFNQNLDHTQQEQFIQTFRNKIDDSNSPYEKIVQICSLKSSKKSHKVS